MEERDTSMLVPDLTLLPLAPEKTSSSSAPRVRVGVPAKDAVDGKRMEPFPVRRVRGVRMRVRMLRPTLLLSAVRCGLVVVEGGVRELGARVCGPRRWRRSPLRHRGVHRKTSCKRQILVERRRMRQHTGSILLRVVFECTNRLHDRSERKSQVRMRVDGSVVIEI